MLQTWCAAAWKLLCYGQSIVYEVSSDEESGAGFWPATDIKAGLAFPGLELWPSFRSRFHCSLASACDPLEHQRNWKLVG
jgi:hypothetical protein